MGSLVCGVLGPSIPRHFLEARESPEYDEPYFHVVPLSLERSLKGYGVATRKSGREYADVFGREAGDGEKIAVIGGHIDPIEGFVEYSRFCGTWAFNYEQ